MLKVIVLAFDLGRSYGKVRSGKRPENVLKRSGNLYSKLRSNPVNVGFNFCANLALLCCFSSDILHRVR